MELTTPSILFSTISLLMASYMIRFSRAYELIDNLLVKLNDKEGKEQKCIREQIDLLSKRIIYIRRLQYFAIFSLIASTVSIFLLLAHRLVMARIAFGLAIIFFLCCILIVLIEIYYSVKAIDINLKI
ncbi:DUF2721 domain-containing protein [Natroniella sulfidigena]|uniref:DUF2721 domain-containing protein n=1 Tax=Natroniella sulfidigena TaxID=723921 RepID=UPI00200B78E4|nr:DUF2721 domain-containing protein [Natroniella sulfidigena]MCK8818026.1 DUF2721 domain-containing protein [Natroniella sulfidigena]